MSSVLWASDVTQKRISGASQELKKLPVGPAIGDQLLFQLSASGFQLLCNAADKVFSAESEVVLFDLQY
jgi:hypothetical protein